jgi:hypothetical protein
MQPTYAQSRPDSNPADSLTLAALGVVAYTVGNVLHEGVGHGGACLLSGGTPLVMSTIHMECSTETRLVAAGGTLVNFAVGCLFFVLARLACSSPRLRYFCWLSMTINLMTATGYFLFSGVGGFGDWAVFVKGLGPEWLLRIALAFVGTSSYWAVVRFSLFELRPLIGSDQQSRVFRAARLMRIPYFTGGILACIAGALNPAGMYLVALSAAAATFGGTSGLVWMHNWLKDTKAIPLGFEPQPPPLYRSYPCLVAAAIDAALFVLVLGPGVRFH